VFQRGDPDPWHLSTDNDAGVNFVVSCLIKDGLQVPPFTDHRAGDGQLTALGLNEKIWRDWLHEVVRRRAAVDQAFAAGVRWFPIPHLRMPRGSGNPMDVPGALGVDGPLRTAIAHLWKAWRSQPERLPAPGEMAGPLGPGLYNEFRSSHPRPPYLSVHLADYPSVAAEPVHPGSLVVGRPVPTDDVSYASVIRRGFALLVQAG
jgi:hypothetical protein